MPKIREDEQWVRRCLQAALPGVEVRPHDDGSQPNMHDFDLVRGRHRYAAMEVTAAADAESISLWKSMTRGGRWIEAGLAGGWIVELLPTARMKTVRTRLPPLLAQMERLSFRTLRDAQKDARSQLASQADRMGVVSAFQSPATEFPGSIYCLIKQPPEKAGGWEAPTGDAFAHWVSGWIGEPKQADNLAKLQRSGADERHLFVILPGHTVAPFAAFDLLMRPAAPLPVTDPVLPREVTHLWAMSTWHAGDGFAWSPGAGWSRFQKIH
ncbi:hypothetical protein AB0K66_05255 [Streptomyces werraensis]|uniref:hypothetical protein n=1 Tax=Streptomyces werraensis TaxID=68284 RepID=UPI003430597C